MTSKSREALEQELAELRAHLTRVYEAAAQRSWNSLEQKTDYYWFTSERSSYPSIAQYTGGAWYVIGESQPMALVDLEMRGWNLGPRVGELQE